MRTGLGRALAALAAVALLAAVGPAAPAGARTTVLYDGAVAGETPADQGYFSYQRAPASARATVTAAAAGTIMDSLEPVGDYAGYISTPPGRLPALSRTDGFTLTFTARLLADEVANRDRAGFSLVLLGDDLRGIELAFWSGEVWAQNDGRNDPVPGQALFTRGEGAAFDTAAAPVTYSVAVRGDRYTLLADGTELLAGPLREYRPAIGPGDNPLLFAYYWGRLIFLGDNTSGAGAEVLLASVALETVDPQQPPPPPSPTQPPPTVVPSPTTGPAPAPPIRAYLPAVRR